MPHPCEEHELPCIEAVLAGTLALMTGYSQALQAELGPQQRVSMGKRSATTSRCWSITRSCRLAFGKSCWACSGAGIR